MLAQVKITLSDALIMGFYTNQNVINQDEEIEIYFAM